LHAIESVEIVLGDLLGFVSPRQVLAEVRENRPDAAFLLPGGRLQRIVEPFARHELRNRSADEGRSGRPLTQPDVRGGRKENTAGHAHRTPLINPPSTWIEAPVMYEATSDNRKAATRLNSSVRPYRPSGIVATTRAFCSSADTPARWPVIKSSSRTRSVSM